MIKRPHYRSPSWAHFCCYAFKRDSTCGYRLVTGYRLDFYIRILSSFELFLGHLFYPFFMVNLICLVAIFYVFSI